MFGISDWRVKLLLRLPLPLSRIAYALARSTYLKDRRKAYFDMAFRRVAASQLPGDYLEFGVWRGTSFVTNYKLAQKHGLSDMRFFAFDGFVGLPCDEGNKWKKGTYSCSKSLFLNIIEKAGVNLDKVRVVEGLFSDSLTVQAKKRHGLARAAVVHIDSDLYSAAALVLPFIEDLMDEGSILIFDNWVVEGGEDNCGEKRAFQEWPFHECFEELYQARATRAFVCTKRIRTGQQRLIA